MPNVISNEGRLTSSHISKENGNLLKFNELENCEARWGGA